MVWMNLQKECLMVKRGVDNYDEAFDYASQNFEQLAYLFEYGDYD